MLYPLSYGGEWWRQSYPLVGAHDRCFAVLPSRARGRTRDSMASATLLVRRSNQGVRRNPEGVNLRTS